MPAAEPPPPPDHRRRTASRSTSPTALAASLRSEQRATKTRPARRLVRWLLQAQVRQLPLQRWLAFPWRAQVRSCRFSVGSRLLGQLPRSRSSIRSGSSGLGLLDGRRRWRRWFHEDRLLDVSFPRQQLDEQECEARDCCRHGERLPGGEPGSASPGRCKNRGIHVRRRLLARCLPPFAVDLAVEIVVLVVAPGASLQVLQRGAQPAVRVAQPALYGFNRHAADGCDLAQAEASLDVQQESVPLRGRYGLERCDEALPRLDVASSSTAGRRRRDHATAQFLRPTRRLRRRARRSSPRDARASGPRARCARSCRATSQTAPGRTRHRAPARP